MDVKLVILITINFLSMIGVCLTADKLFTKIISIGMFVAIMGFVLTRP
jgi:hypothetical protein